MKVVGVIFLYKQVYLFLFTSSFDLNTGGKFYYVIF